MTLRRSIYNGGDSHFTDGNCTSRASRECTRSFSEITIYTHKEVKWEAILYPGEALNANSVATLHGFTLPLSSVCVKYGTAVFACDGVYDMRFNR